MRATRGKRMAWLAVALAACTGGGGAAASPDPEVTFVRVFPALSFEQPLFLTSAPGDASTLYVAEQGGKVFAVDSTAGSRSAVLDLGDRVRRSGNEEGLLGLAFDPGFAENRRFYVNYSASGPRRNVIARFVLPAEGAADPDRGVTLLEIAQPYSNHNGGMLAFGPDGRLYIATGDGGSAGDPQDNAQDLGNLLGKILRINADGTVPPDNPFVATAGARGEIWAWGLRNPWRFSFDRDTGALWAGDVGQNEVEEVDRIERGGNYGWRLFEGNDAFNNPDHRPATDFIAPVVTYRHDQGCSVTGGYVYRGESVPTVSGHYLYADFCSGRVWALRMAGGNAVANRQVATVPNPSSFGEDAAGEIYITSFDGGLYRLAVTTPEAAR